MRKILSFIVCLLTLNVAGQSSGNFSRVTVRDSIYLNGAWIKSWDQIVGHGIDSIRYDAATGTFYGHKTTGGEIAIPTGLVDSLDKRITTIAADGRYKPISYVPTWSEITGKPTTFPPSAHTHVAADVTNFTSAARGAISATAPITYSSATGAIGWNGTTSNVPEGMNLYFSNARVQSFSDTRYTPLTRTLGVGTGMTGGGDLSADRNFGLDFNYLDDRYLSGYKQRDAVRVATTANITLSGLQAIDGVTVAAGDRVLVKNQTAGAQNGIYIASSGSWARSSDFDAVSVDEVAQGSQIFVSEGTVNNKTGWSLATGGNIILNTTPLTFIQYSGANSYSAGTGLTLAGNTFSAQTGSNLWNANKLQNIGIATTAPTTGQLLRYDGTSWSPWTSNYLTGELDLIAQSKTVTLSAGTGIDITGSAQTIGNNPAFTIRNIGSLSTTLANGTTANNNITLGAFGNTTSYSYNSIRNIGGIDYTATFGNTKGASMASTDGSSTKVFLVAADRNAPQYSPDAGSNYYDVWHSNNHPAGSAFSPTLTGANVLSSLTTNSAGHVTGVTTRALTASDIGAAASNINLSTVLGNGSQANNNINLGANGQTTQYGLNITRLIAGTDHKATYAVSAAGGAYMSILAGTNNRVIDVAAALPYARYSPDGGNNYYQIWDANSHPAGSAYTPTLTGANVFSSFSTNAAGHVTGVTTRTLTPGDIGAAASNINLSSVLANGNMTGNYVIGFNKLLSSANQLIDLQQGYSIYSDNVGAIGGNTRLWFDAPNVGDLVFGPRAGSSFLRYTLFKTDSLRLYGTTSRWNNILMGTDGSGNVVDVSNSFIKNQTATAQTGGFIISGTGTANILQANGALRVYRPVATTAGDLGFYEGTSSAPENLRWQWIRTTAEGSGNTGNDLNLRSFSNTGAPWATPLSINRSTSVVTMPGGVRMGNASGIIGSGTGTSNISYLSFYENDGATRSGYIGKGSSSNTELYIGSDIGNINMTPAGGVVNLANSTSNLINWSPVGIGAPTFTTRSAGTKLSIFPNLTANSVDYALGVESSHMWYSVTQNAPQWGFKWYGGTTLAARLGGNGLFEVGGQGRFGGWYTAGVNNWNLPATEIGYTGGHGTIAPIDRSTNTYSPLWLQGGTSTFVNTVLIDGTGVGINYTSPVDVPLLVNGNTLGGTVTRFEGRRAQFGNALEMYVGTGSFDLDARPWNTSLSAWSGVTDLRLNANTGGTVKLSNSLTASSGSVAVTGNATVSGNTSVSGDLLVSGGISGTGASRAHKLNLYTGTPATSGNIVWSDGSGSQVSAITMNDDGSVNFTGSKVIINPALQVAGGIKIKEGQPNSKMGVVTFASGVTSVVVNTTAVAADSRIFLTIQSGSMSATSQVSAPLIGPKIPGSSFTIIWAKDVPSSTGTVAWEIKDPF